MMISEFIIATGMVYIANKITQYQDLNSWKIKEVKPFRDIFNDFCTKNEENYLLIDWNVTKYGAKLIISLKDKDFSKLEKLKSNLEIAYKCDCELTQNENKCTATLDIYRNKLNDIDNRFEPVKLKPYELFISLDTKFKPIIANMHEQTHCLITGVNGSGKSIQLQIMLVNLIATNSNSEIYISNITKSPDFRYIKECRQTKGYVETIDETLNMITYVMNIYDKRLKIINSKDCDNILDYNNRFRNKQMSYIYVVIDEFAQYFPDDKDDIDYDNKIKCKTLLKKMSETMRKAGIYLLISTQRPDKESISPSMKCNLKTKIGFAQLNQASSLVVSDDVELVGLENRKFMYISGNQKIWGRSLYLDKSIIQECLKLSTLKNRTKLDDFNKFLKQDKEIEMPKTHIKRKKVIPLSEVATTSSTKVKNIEVIENVNYVVEDGHILLRIKNREV